ncbi:hypothetical protein RvY_06098-2 [Ramazzottius varieornatus]|uniref:EF-hand domain-containing protein n=1 Tax=Ramazzottius varieornatus TaxID=947166 RepID=A0A1D1V0E2_RAMVA|nr:hypothetical protein RvY_06098-2 [Ramazzottius varieornatus]
MAQFFNQNEIDEFKECFNLYATKGLITSLAELSKIMRSLGLAPTNKELTSYFQNKDISFPAFLDIMHKHKESENAALEILKGFKAMDQRGKGEISAKDLMHILTNTGEKMSRKEVEAIFREGKIAPNGIIQYEDFVKSFTEPVPDY